MLWLRYCAARYSRYSETELNEIGRFGHQGSGRAGVQRMAGLAVGSVQWLALALFRGADAARQFRQCAGAGRALPGDAGSGGNALWPTASADDLQAFAPGRR